MVKLNIFFFKRKKKQRRVDRSQTGLISTTVKLTPKQRKYLEKMSKDHKTSMSAYLRTLLGKDMLGFKTPDELLSQFRIPIGYRTEESTEATITTKKGKRKVEIRAGQEASLPTHGELMVALKKKFKEKGLA